MVDFARVRNRIYYGYGKAAKKLGVSFNIYRSPNGINPIQSGNLIGTQLIAIDDDLTYMKARRYGDNVWQFMPQDGIGSTLFALNDYDYMVGPAVTYFIADVGPPDRLSPPLCVECNDKITVVDPANALTPGINPYQQYQPSQGTTIVSNCPVSLLQAGRGITNNLGLPSSCKLPFYDIVMPDFDDILIKVGFIVTDSNNRRMVIVSAEQTKVVLGFRIIAAEVAT